MNILDNLKSLLFCFHIIDVLDSEKQLRSGKIRTGSGALKKTIMTHNYTMCTSTYQKHNRNPGFNVRDLPPWWGRCPTWWGSSAPQTFSLSEITFLCVCKMVRLPKNCSQTFLIFRLAINEKKNFFLSVSCFAPLFLIHFPLSHLSK